MFPGGIKRENGQKRFNQIYNTKMRNCLENFIFLAFCFMGPIVGEVRLKKKGV